MAEARAAVSRDAVVAETNGDEGGAASKDEEDVAHQHVIMEGQHAEQEASCPPPSPPPPSPPPPSPASPPEPGPSVPAAHSL